jgi:hypothetical protein
VKKINIGGFLQKINIKQRGMDFLCIGDQDYTPKNTLFKPDGPN